MSKQVRATIEISGWKQHQCVACGCLFSYRMRRWSAAWGVTPQAAAEHVRQVALRRLKQEVDQHPCPTCGTFQPILFIWSRGRRLIVVALVGWLFLLCPLLIVALQFQSPLADGIESILHVPPSVLASWCTVPIAFLFLVVQLWIARHDPNRNPEYNLLVANKDVREKTLVVDEPAEPARASLPPDFAALKKRHWLMFGLLVLGCFAPAAAEATRLANGWVTNLGWQPTVAGPGDSVTMKFSQPIRAVAGKWMGTSRATITNSADLGIATAVIGSSTRSDDWEESIRVEHSDNGMSYVWLSVTVPRDERLAQQSLDLELQLEVLYPERIGNQQFANRQQSFSANRELKLSSARAGTVYASLWWTGQVFALLSYFIGGMLLWTFDERMDLRSKPHVFMPDVEEIG